MDTLVQALEWWIFGLLDLTSQIRLRESCKRYGRFALRPHSVCIGTCLVSCPDFSVRANFDQARTLLLKLSVTTEQLLAWSNQFRGVTLLAVRFMATADVRELHRALTDDSCFPRLAHLHLHTFSLACFSEFRMLQLMRQRVMTVRVELGETRSWSPERLPPDLYLLRGANPINSLNFYRLLVTQIPPLAN